MGAVTWRVARSLEILLNEINRAHPNRSKASDGSIGDAAHQDRTSDHNPWIQDEGVGVVSARDFTNDPDHGFDSSDFAEWLRQRCINSDETRVKYLISDRRIANGDIQDWSWRPYPGSNPHLHHVHISVKPNKKKYDDTRGWGYPDPAKEGGDVEWTDKVKLTETDASIWNAHGRTTKYKAGSEVSFSDMVRYPTLARKLDMKVDKVLALLAQEPENG